MIKHFIRTCVRTSSLDKIACEKQDIFLVFRLLAALLVLYAHAYHIYGLGADPLTSKTGIYSGTLAVYIFFTISGFFIVKSAMDRDIIQYIIARFFRIYPALIVCNIVTIIVIIPIAMRHDWLQFVLSAEAREYIIINSVLETIKFSIEGIFSSNPDKAINGSLWTLPVEIRAYLIALLLTMLGITTRKSVFNAFLFIAISINFIFPDFYNQIFPIPNSSTLIFFFMAGSAFYINRTFIPISPVLSVAIILGTLFFRNHLHPMILSVLLSYLVISTGYIMGRIIKIKSNNDYSYGCYLYAYPLSQLSYIFFSDYGFSIYIIFIVSSTLIFSIMSWHLVENPANRLSKSDFIVRKIKYILEVSKCQRS